MDHWPDSIFQIFLRGLDHLGYRNLSVAGCNYKPVIELQKTPETRLLGKVFASILRLKPT
jgi:hypothetical protein